MKLSKAIEAIRNEWRQPSPEPRGVSQPTKGRKRKMAKKTKADAEDEAPPAKSKKKSKAAAEDDGGDYVTVEDLANEAEITPQSARVKLRDAEVTKPEGGRWRWTKGSKSLKAAREVLGL